MTEHAILVFARYRRFHVTHPDGTDLELNYTGRRPSHGYPNPYAEDAWKQKNPNWDFNACNSWAAQATVTETRGWEARWCDSAGWQTLNGKLAARFGAPVEATVSYLNSYAAAGWVVAHVSEDRGVYFGADVDDESFVTRIRYLLIRS
jgi:hypothetical protein